LGDKDAVVRQAAAFGLGQSGPRAELALPNLLAALNDKHPLVRSSAASSLRLIGQPTITALSNVLDHADPGAQEAGLTEFFQLYRSFLSLTKPLSKMAHAEDAQSRCLALEALGALRASDETTIQSFLDALADPVAEVRLASAKALSLLGSRARGATGGLRKCLQDPCVAVRVWAAKDLGAVGRDARIALPDLNDSLHDQDQSVRNAAQEAINSIVPGASK
jgi:HEAT repeat protein